VSMGNINVGSGNEVALAPGLLTRKNARVQGYLRYDPVSLPLCQTHVRHGTYESF
jgi:hypothetical protein